jgi:peptide deformylase
VGGGASRGGGGGGAGAGNHPTLLRGGGAWPREDERGAAFVAVLKIRTFGAPVLRQRAKEVEKITDAHRGLIRDMFETMRDAPGVGLAAPQVGVMDRIFVYEVEEDSGVLINAAVVEKSSEEEEEEEACLSLPGLAYPVARHTRVTVSGLDEEGEPVSVGASGLLARVFQHEIDHLDGVLFVDRLAEPLKKEALTKLREQALGLAVPAGGAEVAPEGAL